ncbi:EAL domain-containing protein [Psychromonas sp.]|nr:EAL domain-containing protein [Psychromonas sp.]
MIATENVKFVARQAIMNRKQKVFAYELLYRNSNNNFFPAEISDHVATARLFFDSLLFFGIDNLADSKKLFINLSSSSILHALPKLIKPENVVFEIIERMEVDELDDVLDSVDRLIKNNYIFALDDYDGDVKWDKILQKVQYIKIEVDKDINYTLQRVRQLKSTFPNKHIIVERIEDYKTYELLHEAGADFFQGYYFMKPKVVNFKNVNPSQLTAIDLLKITIKKPIDFSALINKIEKDVGLVSGLLRLANIRCKTSNKKISSIAQAVIYLGEDTIKQFVLVLSLGDLGDGKPSELLKIGLIRAKFIELLLGNKKPLNEMGYLLGVVSILPALIDVDLNYVFEKFSLDPSLQLALQHYSGELGPYLALCLKVENNDFYALQASIEQLNLDENFVMHCYANALAFGDESII